MDKTKLYQWINTPHGHELMEKTVRFDLVLSSKLIPVQGNGTFQVRTREEEDDKKSIKIKAKDSEGYDCILCLSQNQVDAIQPDDSGAYDYKVLLPSAF